MLDLGGLPPAGGASAPDTLIFRVSEAALSLVGGTGRGSGWMGIVDLPLDGEPLAAAVLRTSRPARVDAEGEEPLRVVGPYWAMHAFVVPVGVEHLVVFGSQHLLEDSDATLVPAAARLVAELRQVPPDRLLADELEVVQAVRDLMDCRTTSIADTARHVAARAADPLSCEVGAVLVRSGGRLVVEVVTRDWPARLDPRVIRWTLVRLFGRVEDGAVLEPELEAVADDELGRNQGLVARFAVPIGRPVPFGVLVVAHAASRPRGFTNLCQRIGRALADAAEPLLLQAIAREELTLERDRFAHKARTDSLTGLDNRAGWEEVLAYEEARRARFDEAVSIVSVDVDGLKAINDRLGHAAGDEVIRHAADLLRASSRAMDRVARVGGDEFLILMPETGAAGAARFIDRVSANAAKRRGKPGAFALSLGSATAVRGETLAETVLRADAAMYTSRAARSARPARASRAPRPGRSANGPANASAAQPTLAVRPTAAEG